MALISTEEEDKKQPVTCEQKHIHRLLEQAKADLQKIDNARKSKKQEIEQLELSKIESEN